MKKLLFLLVLCSIVGEAKGQSSDNISFKGFSGKKALCFSFTDFELEKFDGGIGWRKWTKDDVVWFFSVNLDLSKEKTDNKTSNDEADRYIGTLGISTGIEMHRFSSDRLSPYYGFGLGILGSINDLSHEGGSNENKVFSINGDMLIGAEYLLTEDISISAQYNIGLEYRKTTNLSKSTYVTLTDNEVSTLNFGINKVMLVLSFYF